MTNLPLDVWLIVFDAISNHNTLWSTIRNVSHHLRTCVDEFFRLKVLRNTVMDLVYSTIHTASGPLYEHLHVPMLFSRLTENGTRAVFKQGMFFDPVDIRIGSVRGWVPFIERYCRETRAPAPKVENKSPSAKGRPRWEQQHRHWCRKQDKTYTRNGSEYLQYLRVLRDCTSIGRGDRPPYFIKLPHNTHDTRLIDLALDCSAREISFDWCRTFSAFFVERNFAVLEEQKHWMARRECDEELVQALHRASILCRYEAFDDVRSDNYCRARRKRLHEWVVANKKRMSPEHRLITEYKTEHMRRYKVERLFGRGKLEERPASDLDEHEIVPNKCAKDHKMLMKWPQGRRDWKAARKENAGRRNWTRCTCMVM
ncbi:hypothetical protein BKA63DRAFT_564228 [Paraphoma chrysanthemicola]|nr:hypothetical protein BKA63DRAFT_564228 [Paraphoma chrysanthemicola]